MTDSNNGSNPEKPEADGASDAHLPVADGLPAATYGSSETDTPAPPLVTPKRQNRISWVWLVPFIAALIGASLLVKGWMHAGPVITVTFESAEGLEVGQTKVRYKDVVIGQVTDIRVASDRSNVVVQIDLNRDGSSYITQQGTRFWVVRPRLGVSGVSGLGTLFSGAYIGVDADAKLEKGEPVYDFTGLEKPPEIASGRPGTRYTLNAPDLGSLEIGSPVYYRRIVVGQITGYGLNKDGRSVDIQIFVDAPNDRFVTSDARFWNASGINFSLNADGLSVQTGSLSSVIAGGVMFASADEKNTSQAKSSTLFNLSKTRELALADPDGPPFIVEMHFQQSVRGLKVGAPVDFRGLELGKVYDIDLEFNRKIKRFFALVKVELYPLRLGPTYEELRMAGKKGEYPGHALLGPLIDHGLRAQIRAGNLLTGQQYIALDFFPDSELEEYDDNAVPLILPTVTGSFDRLQQQISSIVSKIDKVPFEGIGSDLRDTLKSASSLLNNLETKLSPEAAGTLKAVKRSLSNIDKLLAQDSPMNDNLERTLRELGTAAKSLRALADYLQTHPTSLIRGRPADILPGRP